MLSHSRTCVARPRSVVMHGPERDAAPSATHRNGACTAGRVPLGHTAYERDAMCAPDTCALPYLDAAGRTIGERERALGGSHDGHYMIADLDRRLQVRQSSLPRGSQPQWRTSPQGLLVLTAEGMERAEGARWVALDAAARHVSACLPWLAQAGDAQAMAEEDHGRVLEALARALPAPATTRDHARAQSAGTLAPRAMTIAYTVWPWLYLVSMGESRALLLRRGELHALAGGRPGRAASPGPATQASLGSVDARTIRLQEGDAVLVCSTRLVERVSRDELVAALDGAHVAATACDRLLQAATSAGAGGPLTAVIFQVGCTCTPWR